jgi:hypothetical protein
MRKIVSVAIVAGALVALGILGAAALAGPSAKHTGHGWARVAGIGAAANAAAAPAHAVHLVLYARLVREDFVDVGTQGESTGDSDFFEEVIWNAGQTARVGQDAVECRLGIRTFNCAGTLLLFGRGKIQVEGAFFGERDSVIPITGGTRNFAGVGGQMVVTNINSSLSRYDLWLVR